MSLDDLLHAQRRTPYRVVTIGAGLVQVLVDDATPSLRQGDALNCDAARVTGWRNLGDGDALLFWTVVPPAPERE